MAAKYFEDFAVGYSWTSQEVELTEAEIVAFAKVNDPQPMHTDPVAAAAGRFGGLIASGWQVAALSTRLFIEAGGYGDSPVVGMGVDELRWKKPVRPGDRLHVVREIVELRAGRPGYGVIRTRVSVINQDGEAVMTLISMGQVPTRAV
ncbi:MAG: MaoC family dehydratase [Devosia sp.]